MEHKEFETIELSQLEQVAGGGKIARKIKKGLKKFFGEIGVVFEGDLDPDFEPSDPTVSIEYG